MLDLWSQFNAHLSVTDSICYPALFYVNWIFTGGFMYVHRKISKVDNGANYLTVCHKDLCSIPVPERKTRDMTHRNSR